MPVGENGQGAPLRGRGVDLIRKVGDRKTEDEFSQSTFVGEWRIEVIVCCPKLSIIVVFNIDLPAI